jgi:HEAT repeat protein
MRRIVKTAAALVLVAGAPGLASVAFAHGGSYRGPAGEVPPDSREPSDPPPPPEGGGPSTPGGETPSGPTTGGPDAGSPSTPSGGTGGSPSGGGGGSGPSTGGGGGGGPSTGSGRPKGAGKGAGYEDWTFWWNYNKDEILQLKSAVKRMQKNPTTGSSAGAFGKTNKSGTAIKSATDESIQKSIVPLLHQFLDDKEVSFHIQSAAELGLAKIGDDTIIETLKKMAANEAKPPYHREVQESAGLAFGLLQKDTEEVRSFLIEVIKDGGRDDSFLRPFSAISLGLLGDKNDRDSKTRNAILDVLSHKEAKGDIKPSCLAALGLLGNDAVVGELLNIVQTGKTSQKGSEPLNDTEIAYAISALGKIGRPGTDKVGQETAVLDEMFKIADSKAKTKHSPNLRRSAAIALGQIGPNCADAKVQKKAMEVLKGLTEDAQDTQEKNFAIISLGRMGAAKGVDEKLRGEMIAVLGKELKDGKGLTPPFAALALGLIGRSFSEEGKAAPEEDIRAPIRKKFDEEKEAKARGAYAVASGLVKDPLAVEKLKAVLTDAGADKRVRGYCALGLGMIGAPEAVEAIKSTLKNDNDRDLRVQTAMAAGLLGDGSVIEDIVKILKDKDASNYELGSAALALGQIGDESAIDALVEIAKDEKKAYPDLTRALATVALGQIGDRKDVPTLSRVATDINYRAHVAAITELLTIL